MQSLEQTWTPSSRQVLSRICHPRFGLFAWCISAHVGSIRVQLVVHSPHSPQVPQLQVLLLSSYIYNNNSLPIKKYTLTDSTKASRSVFFISVQRGSINNLRFARIFSLKAVIQSALSVSQLLAGQSKSLGNSGQACARCTGSSTPLRCDSVRPSVNAFKVYDYRKGKHFHRNLCVSKIAFLFPTSALGPSRLGPARENFETESARKNFRPGQARPRRILRSSRPDPARRNFQTELARPGPTRSQMAEISNTGISPSSIIKTSTR